MSSGANIASIVAIRRITDGKLLANFVKQTSMLRASALACVGVFALAVGIDIIISAILGAIERKKLEAAIAELDKELESFEPFTETYTETIYQILGAIKLL